MTERSYDLRGKRVWVAGHRGMVGSALVRRLAETGCEILTAPRDRVDLRRQAETEAWMAEARPQAVFLAAARVGGILANDSRPADFIYDNLMIEANVIDAAWRCGVEKLLFLGSSCIYPREAAQPIAEPALLSGPLEPTNEWYAIAKIAGTNLYGPDDTYDLAASHVIPALIAKMHLARETDAPTVEIWGSGRPRREFLYVDDLADALVWLMERYDGETHVNVGTGEDLSIADLARRIGDVVGFRGDLAFDTTKPDGTPRKLLDVSRLRDLGWTAATPLAEGLARTYEDFRRRGAPGVAATA